MHPALQLSQVKITSRHRERKAVIYIRQSSPKQVREHFDSQLTQRALVGRAQNLGWHPERIDVFDGDLGQSAAGSQERSDFKALAAEVALGHVGIVFGWQVSRLARNNADWYQLLDLAALFGTLIGDTDGVYDPCLYNDRLLLGLKGTMSEAELYMLRQRLHAGRLSKVQRGEYVQRLPTGLVRLADKRVVYDPDQQVRHVIALVFATFEALGSCYRVLRSCKQQDIRLPQRHVSKGAHGALRWCQPSESAIRAIVTNPAYAGACVHGRRTSEPTRHRPGRRTPAMVRRPRAEWHCLIHDTYPAYSSWTRYLAHQTRLQANAQRYAEPGCLGPGAPREGAALLQGLATGGLCGHRMRVTYRPRPRYVCEGLYRTFAESPCARLDGPSIEAFVIQAFFDAIAPAQLETLDAVLAQRQREHRRLETYYQQQVSQAHYAATLARRRYAHVDPAYRLAAAELEHAWDDKLRALRHAQETAERFASVPCEPTLTIEQRQQLLNLSQHLPDLWQSPQLRHEQRKALLRSLIARLLVARTTPDRIDVRMVRVSGHVSQGVVIPPILRQREVTGHDAMVARLEQLWRDGSRDTQIAATLSREGFRSARRAQVSAATVLKIRKHHQWVSRYQQHRFADKIDAMWTIRGLAGHLGVKRAWLDNRIRSGLLAAPDVIRRPPYGNYLIRDDAELLERLRVEVQQSRQGERTSPTCSILHAPWAFVTLARSRRSCARTSSTKRLLTHAMADA